MPEKTVKIGIIVGDGSGKILTQTFVKFITSLGEKFNISFEFYINSKTNPVTNYKVNDKLINVPFSTFEHKKENTIDKQVNTIVSLLKTWKEKKIKYVFRTSLNADVLYKLRQKARAIKEIDVKFGSNKALILRDEFQGFYANTCWEKDDNDLIEFKGQFDKKAYQEFLKYTYKKGVEKYGKDKFEFLSIYKHHLFNGYFKDWTDEIEKKLNTKILLYQPDTGFTHFINNFIKLDKKNFVICSSNEVGDIIHEFVLNLIGKLRFKMLLYTKNIYQEFGNMIVYQTVHGSADDKKENEINPIATIRLSTDIISRITKNILILEDANDHTKKWINNNIDSIDFEDKKFDLNKIKTDFLNYLK